MRAGQHQRVGDFQPLFAWIVKNRIEIPGRQSFGKRTFKQPVLHHGHEQRTGERGNARLRHALKNGPFVGAAAYGAAGGDDGNVAAFRGPAGGFGSGFDHAHHVDVGMRGCTRGSAAAVAVLQAMTSSFMPRSTSLSAASSAYLCTVSTPLVP